jgi:hypothetical protein
MGLKLGPLEEFVYIFRPHGLTQAEVWLEPSSQKIESGGLPYPVLPNQPRYLPSAGDRQLVEGEAIDPIAVNAASFKLLGQVYDRDRAEGTFVSANPAAAAKVLRYHWLAPSPLDDDCFITSAHTRAISNALERTSLWLAQIPIEDGDSRHLHPIVKMVFTV